MPYASLGLTEGEYSEIVKLLGRRPTAAELAMYSVMWSEHCSYKSSKIHLAQFGKDTTPQMKKHLLVGIGQNAGVVDIGEGWAATFKVESHNSPSYIEPYEGAATGVGGCVRDIISMGARPVAVMDFLRVGAIDHPDTARVLRGATAGIAGYGNALGVPTVGGETVFDPTYQTNPLVNALCVGVVRHSDIHLATASGVGNKVVLLGARTGGDGIGGASILASASELEESARPKVQRGDPFTEQRLVEACLQMFAEGLVEGIQDLGAAGVSCATSELASNGEGGMHVDLEKVPLREELTAGEILMSESQERMMAVVAPDKLDRFREIADYWDVECAVIGEVTDTGRLTIDHFGERIVDVDPRTVAHDGPVYDRPYAKPAWQEELNADRAEALARPVEAGEIASQVRSLVASPNLASVAWVREQYDSYAQGNTALAYPDTAGVIRVDEKSGLGIAITGRANCRFSKLDPYAGGQLALAAAYRAVSAVGARPRAASDGLNNGSPEDPDAMWQHVRTITGLADACVDLEVPVIGGNVSLYNSTGAPGTIDGSINPTPIVGVLGVFDDVSRAVPSGWHLEGLAVYLLGRTGEELSGSVWADVIHSHLGGRPPRLDFEAEGALSAFLQDAASQGLSQGSLDLGPGGLTQGLVMACVRYGVGAAVDISELCERDEIDLASALFSESASRALIAVHEADTFGLEGLAARHDVHVLRIGTTGGSSLDIAGVADFALEDLRALREAPLRTHFDY